MKKIIYLSLLLMAPMIIMANSSEHNSGFLTVEGTWFNHEYDLRLQVRESRRAIKVRGLFTNDWRKFRRLYGNTYTCDRGSLITLDYDRGLVFRERRNARPVWFTRHNAPIVDGCGTGYTGVNSNNGFLNNQVYNPDYRYFRFKSPRAIKRMLDGVWKTENGRNIRIDNTRNGIRAKRKGGRWDTYEQGRLPNEFSSTNGTYVLSQNGILTFFSSNGGRSITLRKIR